MSNAYGQNMPYGVPNSVQSPPSEQWTEQSRQSQRLTSTGSFSRRNPPSNFSRGPAGQRQQWPLSGTDQPSQGGGRPSAPPSSIPQYSGNAPRAPSSVYSGAGVWSEDGYNTLMFPSPNTSRPVTGTSIASTSSSYSLPDMPPPKAPQALPPIQQRSLAPPPPAAAPRARAPLGPPPTSRRGPSAHYSQYPQLAYVSPIVEESDSNRNSERGSLLRPGDESRGSYASSNAIPIGVPDYYLTSGFGRGNVDSYVSEYDEPELEPPPEVTESPRQDSPPALVRQASLGKRSKPTLTTIKSGDIPKPEPSHQRTHSDDSAYAEDLQTLPPVSQSLTAGEARPTLGRKQDSDESRRTDSSGLLGAAETTFLERSSSESEKSDFAKYKMMDYMNEPMPERTKSKDPRVESILNRLEKGGALPSSDEKAAANQPTSLAQRVGSKRPPRLNVDAVREAEQRGSLTSLPDLIRRATKLASNLDRGKTASRLGFDWMLTGEEKGRSDDPRRRSGSLSDMISAFPPPAAIGTPVSRGSGRFAWPSHLRHEMTDDDMGGRPYDRPRRRVCGMPVWAFLLLLLLLVLLIAAAVIVPVALIVIPHQSQPQARSMATCQQKLSCANGGINMIGTDNSCRCLCKNGFTGTSCGETAGPSCTTTSVNGISDVTVGDAIPQLLSTSETNFSISLHGEQILSLLSSANVTCAMENSLVSLDGLGARSVDLDLGDVAGLEKPTPTLQRRQMTTTVAPQAAATSDGIVYATGSPMSPSGSGSSSTASASQLDFARVVILLVLQESNQYNDALAARTALYQAFGSSSLGNVTLQNGFSADLNTFRVAVQNGTVFGKSS